VIALVGGADAVRDGIAERDNERGIGGASTSTPASQKYDSVVEASAMAAAPEKSPSLEM